MREPEHFGRVLNWGMIIVTSFYIGLGTIGYVSFGLQFYVPVDIITTGRDYSQCQTVILKMILVLFTCALAVAIPDLGDFIALIGACASSLLALVFPPLIDLLVSRSSSGFSLSKNIGIMVFGIIG